MEIGAYCVDKSDWALEDQGRLGRWSGRSGLGGRSRLGDLRDWSELADEVE